MSKLKSILGGVFLILAASNAFAGKYPGMTDAECEEIDKLTTSTIANMADRDPHYQNAYQILNNHRLIPVNALFWQCDKLPCGPVYEKNIFHFFWSRPLIEAEMLVEGGCYISDVHPFICCADYGHGYALHQHPDNVLHTHFATHLRQLRGVLGSVNDLFRELPVDKRNKIPSFAEVFYLDYVSARQKGIRQRAYETPKSERRTFGQVIEWSLTAPIVFDTIGKSIAYKVSTSENFAKFAASPFFKHIAIVVNGESDAVKKAAKEALLSEIILSFFIDHAGDSPTLLEDVDALGDLIARYDIFGVINEMRESDTLARSFDRFLAYLTSNTSWFVAVSGDIAQLRTDLNVQF